MKTLLTLSVIQTLCLIVLVFAVVTDLAHVPHTGTTAASPQGKHAVRMHSGSPGITEGQLRRIIREEIQRPPARQADREPAVQSSTQPDEETALQRLDAVSRRIDHHKKTGKISERQMAHLQKEIAGLDKAGQRKMLSRLTHALNTGEIDGHF